LKRVKLILFSSDRLSYNPLSEKMLEFTEFYIDRISQSTEFHCETIKVNTIDAALEHHIDGFDYAIFMASGNRIYNSKDLLPELITPFIENPKLTLMGNILDRKEKWYELNHQFFTIDVNNWVKCGRPSYNKIDVGKLIEVKRSDENFHDDYTPLWVEKGDTFRNYENTEQGANLINQILTNDYDVQIYGGNIKSKKVYLYPEYNSKIFHQLILDKGVTEDIDYNKKTHLKSLLHGNSTWVFNTEEMELTKDHKGESFNVISLPSAGFKFLDVVKGNYLSEGGKIIFYDFNVKSVRWIKYILESNYDTIHDLVRNFDDKWGLIGKRGEGLLDDNDGMTDSMRENVNEVYDYYGGIDNFKEYLKTFKGYHIEYHDINIIDNPESIYGLMGGENNLINVSNIYSTDYSNMFYGKSKMTKIFNKSVTYIQSPTLIVGRGVDVSYSETFYDKTEKNI